MAKKNKSFIDGILFFINSLLALALLLSYLAYFIPPNITTLFAFAGLAYPILLILNFGFIIYWILKLKNKFLLSLICIAIGYKHFEKTYQWDARKKISDSKENIRTMSFNVRMFNAYNWIDETDISSRIKDIVSEENPDLLFIQEYYQDTEYTPDFSFPHKYVKLTNDGRNYGLAIFSKFPITNAEGLFFSEDTGKETYNNQFIYADIKVGDKTVRCFNVHFASVGLKSNDYKLLQNPNEGSQEEIKKGVATILKRIHWAFKHRAEQIQAVEKAITDSPNPVILCGDFNDTPHSYTYHRIHLSLNDSFLESGKGFGGTYKQGPMLFRIDHIFHSKEMKAFNYKVLKSNLSDHYPIVTDLEF